ncbi:hypothetical protein BV25DRAFT_1832607 [Artomyces pyxidatus]|uniref:Uncharacterized protein n=1 Tax=Artomyces pyxidatus TaxID=48021 RepID=A0ACB8SIJ6_9AGAM|nr:hypothetical protein BV25DRAFT_1832607 [Artomyces pyxidatus]
MDNAEEREYLSLSLAMATVALQGVAMDEPIQARDRVLKSMQHLVSLLTTGIPTNTTMPWRHRLASRFIAATATASREGGLQGLVTKHTWAHTSKQKLQLERVDCAHSLSAKDILNKWRSRLCVFFPRIYSY